MHNGKGKTVGNKEETRFFPTDTYETEIMLQKKKKDNFNTLICLPARKCLQCEVYEVFCIIFLPVRERLTTFCT
jgi:hypothetical protein